MPKFDEETKYSYNQQKDDDKKSAVRKDILKIDAALKNHDKNELVETHRYIDGKYQACIVGWGNSQYGYIPDFGFNYEVLGVESIIANLNSMKPKLESFALGWNQHKGGYPINTSSDVNVTVNNTVNISISFDETRQKIEDMTALSREQTDEILAKINELEKISQDNSSRKTKWEKVRPIIAFALDKGADVAVAILTLVVQMKLGI